MPLVQQPALEHQAYTGFCKPDMLEAEFDDIDFPSSWQQVQIRRTHMPAANGSKQLEALIHNCSIHSSADSVMTTV